MDASRTIAGGADGRMDYCIKVLGNELLCVEAERQMIDNNDEATQ